MTVLRLLVLFIFWLLACRPTPAHASIPRDTVFPPVFFSVHDPLLASDENALPLTLHLDGLHNRDGPTRRVLVRQNPWSAFDPEGLEAANLFGFIFESSTCQYQRRATEEERQSYMPGFDTRNAARNIQQWKDNKVAETGKLVGAFLELATVFSHGGGGKVGGPDGMQPAFATAGARMPGGVMAVPAAVPMPVMFNTANETKETPKGENNEQGRDEAGKFVSRNPGETKAGAAAEDLVAKKLADDGKLLGRNVSVNASEGRRVLDNLATENGNLVNVEVKSESAERSASQIAKDNAMATEGGTIVGKNAPENLRGQTHKIETQVVKVSKEDLLK